VKQRFLESNRQGSISKLEKERMQVVRITHEEALAQEETVHLSHFFTMCMGI
jgi:hypothetical protein